MMDTLPDGWALIDPVDIEADSPPSPRCVQLPVSNASASPCKAQTVGTTLLYSPAPMSLMT